MALVARAVTVAGLLAASVVASGDPATTALGVRQLADAVNFAIAEVASDGRLLSTKTRWGLSAVSSMTCAPTPSSYVTPHARDAVGALREVLETGHLQVAALGPYNWGSDGNYLATPPVGFWPDYVDAVAASIATRFLLPRVRVNRTFYPTSNAVLAAVSSGRAHLSEPYFNLGGFFEGKPRGVALAASCSVLGYDSTFFVRPAAGVSSVAMLQAKLRANSSRTVGVLSEGDWHSVQPAVPAGTPHRVFQGTRYLEAAVQSGDVFAGMVSGTPNATLGFQTFSSEIVTVRAFLLPPQRATSPTCPPGTADAAAAVRASWAGAILAFIAAAAAVRHA